MDDSENIEIIEQKSNSETPIKKTNVKKQTSDTSVNFEPEDNELKINIKLDDLKKIMSENSQESLSYIDQNQNEIIKAYEKYREKYSELPDFEKLDDQFEISILEINNFFLRNIRRRMMEKIDFFSKILEIYLNPEPLYSISIEMQNMDENLQNSLNTVYKELMYFEKLSLEIAVDSKNDREVEFICSVFGSWDHIKKELHEIMKTAKESWKKELKDDPRAKYFN